MKSYHTKYFPLEFDPQITYEEKYRLMDEWWTASNGALLDEKAKLETLFEAVSYAKMSLRPGFCTVAQLAYQYDIPIVVFSAGITQIIEEILRKLEKTDLLLPNVHVIANDLIMDENNVVVAFKDPLIQSLNKKDTSVKLVRESTQEWFEPLKSRKNVLLMGDNLGDSNMSDGYDGDEDVCIIKVGFLNANEHVLLDQYKKAFDIVVLHDGPMVPVATFLQDIIGERPVKHDFKMVQE
jgi:HAD superfamily hydrolase (TIGR01544 family)